MRLKNFALAFIFLSLAAVTDVPAQLDPTGWITGRVTTAGGRGVNRANITIIDLMTLQTQTRTTNDSGYFRFNDLLMTDNYLIEVKSKRYAFSNSNRFIQFTDFGQHFTFTADN